MFRDDQRARSRDLVQARVPEQVLAAGWVTPRRHDAGWPPPGAAVGRPDQPARAWLGVTHARIYAFVAADDGVGELVGVWDRADTTVTRSARLAAIRLRVGVAGHAHPVELEARRWGAGIPELVRLLLDPTRTA